MCTKHRRYKAVRQPTTDCAQCWLDFLEKNPDNQIRAGELARILCSIIAVLSAGQSMEP